MKISPTFSVSLTIFDFGDFPSSLSQKGSSSSNTSSFSFSLFNFAPLKY